MAATPRRLGAPHAGMTINSQTRKGNTMTDDSKVASAATHDAGKPDATSPAATTPSTTSPSVSASLDPKHMAMRTSAQERKVTDVLIVCGGLSHEREISVRSGHRVGGFLEEAGWTVHFHDMDSTLLDYLSDPSTRPDIVWPLLHGANGEDGSIRDVLELVGLPYIGSRAKASRTAWSKPIAKNVVRKLGGLSTPHSVTLPESLFRELGVSKVIGLLVDSLGLPLFIKPTMGGSALGCTMVTKAEQLPQALVSCFAYGDVALVERAITGTEVSVSILDIDGEPLVLSPLEIVTPNGTYDYDARYTPGPTDFYVPARLDAATMSTIRQAALTAHRVLSLRDISRTDFIVDDQGVPQFLESNVTPGMTDTSLLPQAADADAYHLPTLYSRLVESVLAQHRAVPYA